MRKMLFKLNRGVLLSLLAILLSCGASYAASTLRVQPPRSHDRHVITRPSSNKYTRPQVSHRVTTIPSSRIRFEHKHRHYYFAEGMIYSFIRQNHYETVKIAEGMVIPNLPVYKMKQMVINRRVYYEYYGIIFKSVNTRRGREFEVVGWME